MNTLQDAFKRVVLFAVAGTLALGLGCSLVAGGEIEDSPERIGLAVGLVLTAPSAWQRVDPVAGSITIPINGSTAKTFSYTPACSGRPGNDSTYAFFVKPGTSNNLLINFMGGGACWDARNCLGVDATRTFISELGAVNLATRALASPILDAGVLNHREFANPFAGWTMVFIPYCTGDIFWGSKDTSYTDPVTGSAHTIRHRGFDNFLAVLAYLKTNYPSANVGRVFVTGQSAGGYGAIYNFPYIKETYFTNQVDVLGDAAAGAIPGTTQFQSTIRTNWAPESTVANWITGLNVTGTAFDSLTLGNFYQHIASHANYATSRFAHYTTEYDGNQRYFYNVQTEININNKTYVANSTMFGPSSGFQVADSVSCEWRTRMKANMTTAATTTNGNFRSYNAPGEVHTISMSNAFFTETSNGTTLLAFYQNMLAGSSAWQTVQCSNCSPPTTSSSPNGISCP